MHNFEIREKMNNVEELLINNHDLFCTYQINVDKRVHGWLSNKTLPCFIVYFYLTEKTIDTCSTKMIVHELQYKYGCDLLKKLKIKLEVD